MRVESKSISIVMKVLIGGLSLVVLGVAFILYGTAAWRLLFTWVLLLAGIYYLVTAAILVLSDHHYDYTPCPMLVGLFIVNFLLISLTSFIFAATRQEMVLLSGLPAAILYGTLPVLVLADWLLFARKGHWRIIFPFYWLALPTAYVAFIILTATMSPNAHLAYPLAFLDWQDFGFSDFYTYLLIFAVLILVAGYVFTLFDGLISGKVAQYIVLPRIETIEEADEDSSFLPDSNSSS